MTDDKITAALEEIRERQRFASDVSQGWQRMDERRSAQIKSCYEDVPRLLVALVKVLERHQPRPLYQMVEDYDGDPVCGHDEDYDGDSHYEADNGIWYCKDKITGYVCVSCADGPDGDLWAEWPCPTYEDITRTLLGEDHDERWRQLGR